MTRLVCRGRKSGCGGQVWAEGEAGEESRKGENRREGKRVCLLVNSAWKRVGQSSQKCGRSWEKGAGLPLSPAHPQESRASHLPHLHHGQACLQQGGRYKGPGDVPPQHHPPASPLFIGQTPGHFGKSTDTQPFQGLRRAMASFSSTFFPDG